MNGRLLWHPHQKLWNRELVAEIRRLPRPAAAPVVAAVVLVDSALLWVRVALRRLRLGAVADPHALPVVYLDCGTHRDAAEATWVRDWLPDTDLRVIAFEASPRHAAAVRPKLERPGSALHELALVGPEFVGDSIRLYRASEDGRGDSLFSARGEEYDDVATGRLSDVLRRDGVDVDGSVVLLRMNIEGAEQYVVDDLIDSGLVSAVDGYYGMWDDLGKMDAAADEDFRRRLKQFGVRTVPFNERDLRFRVRRSAIRFDIETSRRHAAKRKASPDPAG